MTRQKYTTVNFLRQWESNRHLTNLAVERSNGVIADADVKQKLDEVIQDSSRDFDGYLRGHLDVPFDDTVTALTGVITFTNGSTTVTAVGGAFVAELAPGDRIILDAEDTAEATVATVTDNDNLVLEYEYYGIGAAGAASSVVTLAPREIEILARGHTLYNLWARRGRLDAENPFNHKERLFEKRVKEFQKGTYRIDTATGDEVAEKEALYNTTVETVLTETAIGDYLDPS